MHDRFTQITGTAVLLFAMTCAPAAAQAAFKEFVEYALISDMSADGSVIVGTYDGPTAASSFRWTASGGLELIGRSSTDVRISRDGKTIVGTMPDSRGCATAAIWQSGTNWRLLAPFPGVIPSGTDICTTASGVSADGSVIVGGAYVSLSKIVAFRWDAQTGMVNLGTFDEGETSDSSPYGVSANGRTIIGWDFKAGFLPPGPNGVAMNQRRGSIWWDGRERLLHAFGWAGEAWATNNEGSIIVGQFHPLDQYNDPRTRHGASTYRYTAWDGHFEDLGAIPVPVGDFQRNYVSQPYGVSDDGAIVVGESGLDEKTAMIWTADTHMISMSDYLTQAGVTDHLSWVLRRSVYVSPDGRIVAGLGQRLGGGPSLRSWIVTLR